MYILKYYRPLTKQVTTCTLYFWLAKLLLSVLFYNIHKTNTWKYNLDLFWREHSTLILNLFFSLSSLLLHVDRMEELASCNFKQ